MRRRFRSTQLTNVQAIAVVWLLRRAASKYAKPRNRGRTIRSFDTLQAEQ